MADPFYCPKTIENIIDCQRFLGCSEIQFGHCLVSYATICLVPGGHKAQHLTFKLNAHKKFIFNINCTVAFCYYCLTLR